MFQVWSDTFKNRLIVLHYHEIPNINPGLIYIFKHILRGLYSGGGLIFGWLIFKGYFVLASAYQNIKNFYRVNKISISLAKKICFQAKITLFCFETYLNRPNIFYIMWQYTSIFQILVNKVICVYYWFVCEKRGVLWILLIEYLAGRLIIYWWCI